MHSAVFCICGGEVIIIVSIAEVTLWTMLRAEVKEKTRCTYEIMQTLFNLQKNALPMFRERLRAGLGKSEPNLPPPNQEKRL